ncbi:AAA family ATPase [Albidovulum sediminicola]|uniref:AAA family ATPase n=1 Tax=Albidovulum sediminicola TaxID=2984331 RepID=A0ABT2Z367_9RHOB|nr:AAA family ATPase [Defluviimonas sp. WL0075]MCV2865573.1 AAA family ATPase [Defluviimonas sp. WL0075]
MSNAAALQSDPAPIVACTVSRDVSAFDLLIEDMETELGDSWGDLGFEDAIVFLGQPDADALQFIAIAVDGQDEQSMARVGDVIAAAKAKGIRVILIAEEVGPIALHQLLKHGADDFVPYPLPENALHEAIDRIRKAPVVPEAHEPSPAVRAKGDRDGMILPVHGLAGGVGATTFAVNLAWELAVSNKKNPPKVCLLDLDFQFGSVSTYLDLPRREAVYEMLSDTAKLDRDIFMQSMLSFNDRMHVLTAPADMLPLDIVQSDDINRILDMARSHFDFVIIDMPKTVVQWTEAVLQQAKVYFGVMELDMRSAQNTLRLIRALKAEDLPFEKFRYILNRAPGFTDLTGKGRAKRLAESLDIAIEIHLPDGGKMITQANDQGLPLAESAGKSPLRKEIAKLAASLVNTQQRAETASS